MFAITLMEFIKDLQNSGPGRKRKWLLGLSVLAVFLVLFGWAAYFTSSVLPARSPSVSDQSFGFRETFAAGLAVVRDSALAGLRSLGRIWSAPRTYQISP